jgi:hypothetical protein
MIGEKNHGKCMIANGSLNKKFDKGTIKISCIIMK